MIILIIFHALFGVALVSLPSAGEQWLSRAPPHEAAQSSARIVDRQGPYAGGWNLASMV